MLKKKITKIGILMISIIMLFLTACSNESSSNSNKKSKTDQSNRTHEVETVNGKIKVPNNPKRIIVAGYLPTVLLLGEKPVGATKRDVENVHIQDMIDGIETFDDDGYEKMLSLNPDLIISTNSEKEAYEKLSKIAPTVIIPYETYRDVDSEVTAFGEILGKEKEAEAWLKSFHEKVDKQKKRLDAVMDKTETASIIGVFGKDTYIYGDGIYRGGQAIFKQLGMTPQERVKKDLIDKDVTYEQVSFEVIDQYVGDYIFFDASNGGELDRNDPMWQSIKAVQEDKVFYLDGDFFWPYDPIAVLAQVEEVADMIVEFKEKN